MTRGTTGCSVTPKVAYTTKRAAKAVARRAHPAAHLSAYRCGTHWHLGHLPPVVVAGVRTRGEVYARRRA